MVNVHSNDKKDSNQEMKDQDFNYNTEDSQIILLFIKADLNIVDKIFYQKDLEALRYIKEKYPEYFENQSYEEGGKKIPRFFRRISLSPNFLKITSRFIASIEG